MISKLASFYDNNISGCEKLAIIMTKQGCRGNQVHNRLVQTLNFVDLDILIQWCRMAKRELVIEDGKITEVISIE